MAGGAPPVLTDEIILRVEELLPTVFYVETVADLLGITRQTMAEWNRRAVRVMRAMKRKTGKKHEPDHHDLQCIEFFYAVKRGCAEAQKKNLKLITEAAERHWQAAAWLMERRFDRQWGVDRQALRKSQKTVEELEKVVHELRGRVLGAKDPPTQPVDRPAPE